MEDNMNNLQLLVHRYPTITDTYERYASNYSQLSRTINPHALNSALTTITSLQTTLKTTCAVTRSACKPQTPSPDDNFLLEIPDISNRFSDLEFQQSILSAKTFTAHERHILLLLMRGYRPADIAAKYKLSRTAVSKSCRRIKTKFMQNKELACMASSYVFVKDNFSTVFLWFTKLAPVSYNSM